MAETLAVMASRGRRRRQLAPDGAISPGVSGSTSTTGQCLEHTGSRGLGHQVCTDHVRVMDEALAKHGIALPDRQLACSPLSSPEGRDYFGAMHAAANFAWCNRQVLTQRVREVFRRVLAKQRPHLEVLYDVAHNIA